MGRRPKPVDGEVEAVATLAGELRRLRAQAGNPPYRAMAVKARYSASTLSEAASGRRLPTLAVVLAYVAACGAEPEGWEERWRQAATAMHTYREDNPADPPAADPADTAPPVPVPEAPVPQLPVAPAPVPPAAEKRKKITAARGVAIGGALLLLAAVALGISRLPGPAAHKAVASSRSSIGTRVITEDTDPQDTRCDQGEVDTVATTNLYGPARFFLGYVWLRYAPACGAMWTRFEPSAGLAELGPSKITIWLVRPSDGRTLRYDTPYLGEFVYGNMLRTSYGCLKAEATVTASHPTNGPAAALPGTGPIVAHAETRCVPAYGSTAKPHPVAP